jgi:large subunit ribosomal protein L19e
MAGLSLQRRLAAKILKVGKSRIVMDTENLEEIKNAITKADIRKMISHGYIKVKATKLKMPDLYKKKRKMGPGSRKGSKTAKMSQKKKWMRTIRPLRAMLKDMREKKIIDTKMYRKMYFMVKSGAFRSCSHLKLYLKQKGISYEERSKV